MFARWLTLIRGLVGSQKIGQAPVPFGPSEEVVVDAALRLLTGYDRRQHPADRNHHPAVVAAAGRTRPTTWSSVCRYATKRHFLDETRLLRDALGQLVNGTLKGLFDDHTSIALDWTAPDAVVVAVPARSVGR